MSFPTQRQEAFFEGHRQAFEWYGGTPPRISYDNLTAAVCRVLHGRNRQEQEAFIAFRSHYLFESHFDTPGRPREQGPVESLVGYMRRNYLVPVPRVSSYEELNRMLLQRCSEDDQRHIRGEEITIGEAYLYEGEYDLAIADCNKAIELTPNLSDAYNNRGLAYANRAKAYTLLGMDAEAEQDASHAIELGYPPDVLQSEIEELKKQR